MLFEPSFASRYIHKFIKVIYGFKFRIDQHFAVLLTTIEGFSTKTTDSTPINNKEITFWNVKLREFTPEVHDNLV